MVSIASPKMKWSLGRTYLSLSENGMLVINSLRVCAPLVWVKLVLYHYHNSANIKGMDSETRRDL